MSKHAASAVPTGHYRIPLGKANVVREGEGLTILAYGTMVHVALAVVEANKVDAEVIELLKTEAKKRRESQAIYLQAGRPELADKETFELKVIEEFLPRQLSPDEIKILVKELKQSGELPADFGGAMKQVMAKLNGRADGRMVAEAVKASL